MKRSIVGLAVTASLLLASFAHAQATTAPIGNPYTDTLQLWSEIAGIVAYFEHSAATAFFPSQPPSATAIPQQQTASPAEAVASFETPTATSTASATTTTASDQTTLSEVVKSAESTKQATSILSDPATAFNASDFVTQGQLDTQLLQLTNALSAKFTAPATSSIPQSVAADGNNFSPYVPIVPPINNLSNVTITNANLTASEIPALDYFPATNTVSVSYGGTGSSNAPTYGQLLLGNSSGGYTLTATSSLGVAPSFTASYPILYSGNNLSLAFGTTSTNTWSALNLFAGGASTTHFSNFGTAYFGGTATSTFNSAGALSLVANGLTVGTNQLVVAGGNISIGTTTPWSDIANAGALLDLTTPGTVRITLHDTASTQEEKLSSDGTGFYIDSAGAASASNNNIVFRVSNANSSYTTFEAGRFTSAGLFGVGTTSPWAQLSASSTSANPAFAVQQNSTGPAAVFLGGNVGIASSSPSAMLDVDGNINIGSSDSYEIGDTPVLYASTALSDYFAGGAGNHTMTGTENTANGFQALASNSTGNYNTAIGSQALASHTAGNNNTAIGYQALTTDSTGQNNTAVGGYALIVNTGSNNTGYGLQALYSNTTGGSDTALGGFSSHSNVSATNTVAVGYYAGFGAGGSFNAQGYTIIGYEAGDKISTDSDYNTFLGYQSGYDNTSGNDNILIGPELNTGGNHLTTGQANICIGYNCILPGGSAANNALNIGNFIFGTGLTATSSATSIPASLSGNLGVATANPYSRLQVAGPDSASSTSAFAVVNSASTTVFSVFDGGNAELSGSLSQSSDERLKTNIQSLEASSSLSFIDELNPVTFNWIDPDQGATLQLGFIAQQVQQIFPNLVSTTSATALTPGGTLSLNYIGLISPIVSAIQALDSEITSIENTIAGFASSFTTTDLTYTRATGSETDTETLCLTSGPNDPSPVCITKAQLAAMLAGDNVTQTSVQKNVSTTSDDEAPQIEIEGDNPAIIQVGATYNDLGATIEGPQADLNLGLQTFVNGVAMTPVQIDTTEAATDTIEYVATDQNGLTSTSTRTVIVEPAQAPSIIPTDDASSTATTTSS